MKARWISPIAVCLLVVAAQMPTYSQERVLIRMGTLAPKGSPWHDILLQIREDWWKISHGSVTIKIYSGVLGDEAEMIRKMRIKQLQAVMITGAALPRIEPAITCLQIPLMFESYDELDYVRDRLEPRLEKMVEENHEFKVKILGASPEAFEFPDLKIEGTKQASGN